MWREAASPAAEPPAGIAAPHGGDADSAGQPGERAGAAACGNPLNPVAAEAAEMLVRAARPIASSTFSGYRDPKWRPWADWATGPCWYCRPFWSVAVRRRTRRRRRVPQR